MVGNIEGFGGLGKGRKGSEKVPSNASQIWRKNCWTLTKTAIHDPWRVNMSRPHPDPLELPVSRTRGTPALRPRERIWRALAGGLLLLALAFWGIRPALAVPERTEAHPKLWEQLGQAHWIGQGHGPHILYMIFDPNCPYCHVLYDELEPMVQSAHLNLRFIVVGFLAPSSTGKAAAILQAKDPRAAIRENEKGFNMEHFGAIREVIPTPETDKILADNLKLLEESGRRIVPTLIYRDRQGKIQVIHGLLDKSGLQATLKQIR